MDIPRLPNRFMRVLLVLFAIAALPVCASGKDAPSPRLAGYVAVPIHYVPLNKMMVSVQINGHPGNLLIDTGARHTILDTDSAQLYGVAANQFGGRRYIGYSEFQGQLLPIAFVRSLTAGSMNLGSSQVLLLKAKVRSGSSGNDSTRVDGVLGTDILLRRQAVINCRTKSIFFKVDRSAPNALASVAQSEGFTRVPLREEENGHFTVPFSVHGQSGRLFVDTGAFVTTFSDDLLKSLGIALQPAHVTVHFSDGLSRQYSMGQVNDFVIGDFKVPPAEFGAAALPKFAKEQAGLVSGILGVDLLYDCHAIIDFGSMNLFLK
jgi:predicted aspartyl protease